MLTSSQVSALLELDGAGERLMPLSRGTCSSEEARERLRGRSAGEWFPGARHARAALSGLYLYFSCWDEAHEIAQSVEEPEGAFWHGIVHRQEPDPANAAYWFRRVGRHAVFPALHAGAREIAARYPEAGLKVGSAWDPFAFIGQCSTARGVAARAALEIQRLEWQLLLGYCARPATEPL